MRLAEGNDTVEAINDPTRRPGQRPYHRRWADCTINMGGIELPAGTAVSPIRFPTLREALTFPGRHSRGLGWRVRTSKLILRSAIVTDVALF